MPLSRKVGLLAAVCMLVLGLSASAAPAFRIMDNVGNPVRDGLSYGENFIATGQTNLTVQTPGGPVTNTCDAYLAGDVTANQGASTLAANIPGHTFSNCSSSPVWATGSWILNVLQTPQNSAATGKFKGTVGGVKVLVFLGAFCEYRGTVKFNWQNGAPSTVSIINTSKLNLYTGNGTFTSNPAACPPSGLASGTLSVVHTADPDGENLRILP